MSEAKRFDATGQDAPGALEKLVKGLRKKAG